MTHEEAALDAKFEKYMARGRKGGNPETKALCPDVYVLPCL